MNKPLEVGQEVVVMCSKSPLHCNTANSPKHPCRTTIVKVGRIYVYGLMTGSDRPVALRPYGADGAIGHSAYPVDVAKEIYRTTLRGYDFPAARIDKLVSGL